MKARKIDLNGKLNNSIIANAEFDDFEQLAYEFKRKGIDVDLRMSTNDVEKTFNYFCNRLLIEQDDEKARYSNVSRSWGKLKSAIRIWFNQILSKDSDYYYRVFLKDVQSPDSKFRPAITQALRDHKPIAEEFLKNKKKKREAEEAPIFTILGQYDFTDEYKEVPQKLCALDKCFVPKKYKGEENELKFIKYLESKGKKIEWWFKNGDQGKNYFAIKYYNSDENKEKLFYPDWIIRFKDGKIGIFDTKQGQTAISQETIDKAKTLSLKIKELGKKYVGGIVVMENKVWHYNNSESYLYSKGNLDKDKNWKLLDELF